MIAGIEPFLDHPTCVALGEIGFDDMGQLWRSGDDMDPDAFDQEIERLWQQVKPLYEKLHCHVRASLAEKYGKEIVPLDQPIPAHLLGIEMG